MINGKYSLYLECEKKDFVTYHPKDSKTRPYSATFYGEGLREAAKKARASGWYVDTIRGECLCPRCYKPQTSVKKRITSKIVTAKEKLALPVTK